MTWQPLSFFCLKKRCAKQPAMKLKFYYTVDITVYNLFQCFGLSLTSELATIHGHVVCIRAQWLAKC